MKGLGEMNPDQLKLCIDVATRYKVCFKVHTKNLSEAKRCAETLLGKDPSSRKEILIKYYGNDKLSNIKEEEGILDLIKV